MLYAYGRIWLQSFAIVETSGSGTPAPETGHPYVGVVTEEQPQYLNLLSIHEWQLSFQTVAAVSHSELTSAYSELGLALDELREMDSDDNDWGIEPSVYDAARQIASELRSAAYPAPKVLTHGPKSVVFNWDYTRDSLYLTISADRLSAFISIPEKIHKRLTVERTPQLNSKQLLASLRSMQLQQPVLHTTRSTSDLPLLIG